MTITQTIEIPADRRITLEVPPQIPVGETARFEIIWFPVNDETKFSAKNNDSFPKEKNGKFIITKELIDEMAKNSPTLQKITGILHTNMTIDEIRTARLAKHL